MYNRTPYNRAPYNLKARFVFEWTATANVESGSGGAVLIIRYLSCLLYTSDAADER